MTTHSETPKIQNPGTYSFPGGLNALFGVLVVIGVAAFAFGLATDPQRAWASFILNHYYFMCLALGGAFFAAIQWLTGAMWSAPVRRMSEAFTSYLPVALLTVFILYFGIHHVYIWSHPEVVKGDHVLEVKATWLSPVFLTARDIVAVLILVVFTRKLIGTSLAQDTSGSYELTLKNRKRSPLFLVLFGVCLTITAWDELMSLDPHWASTMFGVYIFAGLFYANLASTCLLTIYLKSKGKLEGIVNDNHLHDLGKFMFAAGSTSRSSCWSANSWCRSSSCCRAIPSATSGR
jgi:hypothetical protein